MSRLKALVVQGGGMRGVYSMGALLALEEAGLTEAFAYAVGASAGAINSAYFLAGQAQDAIDLYVNHLSGPEFIRWRRFWKPVDVDFVVDECVSRRLPLSRGRLEASSTELLVLLADAGSGSALLCVANRPVGSEFSDLLRATCALPALYNRRVAVAGGLFVDGGVASVLPVEEAEARAGVVLAIATRERGYRSRDEPRWRRWLIGARAWRLGPEARRRITRADERLNAQLERLESGAPGVLLLQPSDPTRLVGRTERSRAKLRDCAEMGREDMKELLSRSSLLVD